MKRTNIASLSLVLLLATACASTQTASSPTARAAEPATPEEAAVALSDAYVAAQMETFPESGMFFGYPRADNAGLGDNSLEAVKRWEQRQDDFLGRARALPAFAPGTRAWLAKGLLIDRLETSVATRVCHEELWSIGSLSGWQSDFHGIAAVQPVGSQKARADALHRFHLMARVVDNEIANQREGLRVGVVASRANTVRMLHELDGLLSLPPEKWPFLEPADRDPDPAFRSSLVAIMRDELVPATRRHRDFLANEYLPRARDSFGLGGLKDGEACYRAAIRRGTTRDLSAEEIHALGLRRLDALKAEMAEIGEKAFGTRDLTKIRRALEAVPTANSSPEALMARASSAVERARAALPRAFHRLPKGRLVVMPIPEFQAKGGASAHYNGSMNDGAFEGIYWLNTFVPPRGGDEAVAFHEGIPGHHLQVALAAEGGDAPDIARYTWNIPYGEGWALYAERLADELGVYSSARDRAGMVTSEAFRAARLVVDTGIHAMGWTREKAIAFMLENVDDNRTLYESEVDRYAGWPGQALGYMIGALEIRGLRENARARLGPRFNLAAFHDLVLEGGEVPLPMLRERVELWVRQNRGVAARGP
jgi:uncharacterized protein (DUF885 family)